MGIEEERKKLLDIIDGLQKKVDTLQKRKGQLDTKQEPSRGFGEYIQRATFYANVPRDPYAHQYMMVNKPPKEITQPSELLSPEVMLSNIKDSRSMILLQRDFYYLHRFFDMGKRSEAILMLFNSLYFSWEGSMRMTATLHGGERSFQSFLAPEEPSGGGGLSFLKKKPRGTKKKKSFTDFLSPSEDDSMYE
jgi:hypothetical protein